MTYADGNKKHSGVEKKKAPGNPKLVNPAKNKHMGKHPMPEGMYGMSEGGAKKHKRKG